MRLLLQLRPPRAAEEERHVRYGSELDDRSPRPPLRAPGADARSAGGDAGRTGDYASNAVLTRASAAAHYRGRGHGRDKRTDEEIVESREVEAAGVTDG